MKYRAVVTTYQIELVEANSREEARVKLRNAHPGSFIAEPVELEKWEKKQELKRKFEAKKK